MTAYYNEFDPYAAQWLRNLIAAGHIAPGDVDERSIADVRPDDLSRYTQCHFFAGIGVWSYALRRAGWADDRPVWTGSCPCQPFSAAGKGGGFDDERHLWPHFHWLISQCRPPVVLGEQVASKDGLAWLDLVQADLEGTGYAAGAVDLCAAGVGAPHIRQRLWWAGERLEDAAGQRREGVGEHRHDDPGAGRLVSAGRSEPDSLDDAVGAGLEGQRDGHRGAVGHGPGPVRPASAAGQSGGLGHAERIGAGRDAGAGTGPQGGPELRPERHDARPSGAVRGLADTDGGAGGQGRALDGGRHHRSHAEQGAGFGGGRVLDSYLARRAAADSAQHANWNAASWNDRPPRPGPTNGLWRDADWLFCRDGKWRPVEPSTFPLAHGAPARVGRLRGYGNAINAEAAQVFIEAVDHAIADRHLRLTLSDLTTDNEGIFA